MKITEIKTGDKVQLKGGSYPMVVVGIFTLLSDLAGGKGTVYLDFEGNEGDVWEEDIEDLEPVTEQ